MEADRDESWLKYAGSLNKLMSSIIQIRSDMKFYSNNKFRLENVSSHPSLSSDPIRALNRAVIDDDAPECLSCWKRCTQIIPQRYHASGKLAVM